MIAQLNQIRRWMGALCVALACLFYAQSSLVTFDRIEHGLELQHEARPLAGTLVEVTTDSENQRNNDDYAAFHQHLNDVSTSILVPSSPAIDRFDFLQSPKAPPRSESSWTSHFGVLERPPKS